MTDEWGLVWYVMIMDHGWTAMVRAHASIPPAFWSCYCLNRFWIKSWWQGTTSSFAPEEASTKTARKTVYPGSACWPSCMQEPCIEGLHRKVQEAMFEKVCWQSKVPRVFGLPCAMARDAQIGPRQTSFLSMLQKIVSYSALNFFNVCLGVGLQTGGPTSMGMLLLSMPGFWQNTGRFESTRSYKEVCCMLAFPWRTRLRTGVEDLAQSWCPSQIFVWFVAFDVMSVCHVSVNDGLRRFNVITKGFWRTFPSIVNVELLKFQKPHSGPKESKVSLGVRKINAATVFAESKAKWAAHKIEEVGRWPHYECE